MTTDSPAASLPPPRRIPFYLAAIVLVLGLRDLVPLMRQANNVVGRARKLFRESRHLNSRIGAARISAATAALQTLLGPDDDEVRDARVALGQAYLRLGQLEAAQAAFAQAQAIFERQRQVDNEMRAYSNLLLDKGGVEYRLGLLTQAEATLRTGTRFLGHHTRLPVVLAQLYTKLAQSLWLQGDLQAAFDASQRALDAVDASRMSRQDICEELLIRGQIQMEKGDLTGAQGSWQTALDLLESGGEAQLVPLHVRSALVALRMGDLPQADRELTRAEALGTADHGHVQAFHVDLVMAQAALARQRRDVPRARKLASEALARFRTTRRSGGHFSGTTLLVGHARLLAHLGIGQAAEEMLRRELEMFQRSGESNLWAARAQQALGTYLSVAGRLAEARTHLTSADRVFRLPRHHALLWARENAEELAHLSAPPNALPPK